MNNKEISEFINNKYGTTINLEIIADIRLKAADILYLKYKISGEEILSVFEEEYSKIGKEILKFPPAVNFYYIKFAPASLRGIKYQKPSEDKL